MRRFIIGAMNDRSLADIGHFNLLRLPHMISQPVVHAPNANRTPNAGDATQTRLMRRHSCHIWSTHAKRSAYSGSAGVGRSSRAPLASAVRLHVIARGNPFRRSTVHASTMTRVDSLACARSLDGFPSGWFERMRSRKRERAPSGVVDNASSPSVAYASRIVTSKLREPDNVR
jgi:hypothetical protein